MIKIEGNIVKPGDLAVQYLDDSIERKIIDILTLSSEVYDYGYIEQLKFEINLRVNIIKASRELNRSGFKFKIFTKAMCNTAYWELTKEGGFLLKKDVKPSDAIKDIYINDSKYGTECSTAIVILYYKAIVDIYPEELFNRMFSGIYLMDWKYIDDDLRIDSYMGEKDYLPGDCRYFKNPDFNHEAPEWQGENAIDLGDGTYYGHGIGIKNAENIIRALNKNRKKGSKISAYLMDSATRPGFKYLADRFYKSLSHLRVGLLT